MKMNNSFFVKLFSIAAIISFSSFTTPAKLKGTPAPTASFTVCCGYSCPNSGLYVSGGQVNFNISIYYGPGAPWSTNTKIGTISSDCWPAGSNRTVYYTTGTGAQFKTTFTTTGDVYIQHVAGTTAPGYGVTVIGNYVIANI
jgi:hypothetical protein